MLHDSVKRFGLSDGCGVLAFSAAGAVAARTALAAVSPLLWLSLAVDLGIKATGPDYGRVARAVALIAQIRLLRTHGWSEPSETPRLGAGRDEAPWSLEDEPRPPPPRGA